MKTKVNVGIAGALTIIAVFLAAIVGWVMNIISLVGFEGTLASAGILEVFRVIGIFVAPLGAILGYF